MPKGLEITFIVDLSLYFLCGCFKGGLLILAQNSEIYIDTTAHKI